jgi:hypothetical protein
MLQDEGLDIENYDIEVSDSPEGPDVTFYCTLKEELVRASGGSGLGDFYASLYWMPRDVYLSLVKKDSESPKSTGNPDLVRSPEAAAALAHEALDARGISVSGHRRTVKSTDTFWLVEYYFPEEKKRPLVGEDGAETAAYEVITAAVSKKTGKAQLFLR